MTFLRLGMLWSSRSSGTDPTAVYQALQSRLAIETKPTEITALLAYFAGLLMLVATALSLWWFGRVA